MTPIKTPFGGTLEFYPLPDTSGKGTVLICPGGGYSFLAEREGRPIADAFNQNGYSAAILNYCLDRDVHGTNPVKELAWAVRYLRTASEWNGLVHKLWVIRAYYLPLKWRRFLLYTWLRYRCPAHTHSRQSLHYQRFRSKSRNTGQ